jgi:ABC-2 type transport system permease protein
MAAKVITSLLMGFLFGLAAIVLSFGVGYAILRIRGIPLELTTSHVVWLLVGTPTMTAAWAALGVGLGAIVRNQVFAVIGLIVWAMVVDNLLRGLIPSIGGYTPVGASAALVADPADYVLTASAGALLLIGYVAACVAGGSLAVARRDVT